MKAHWLFYQDINLNLRASVQRAAHWQRELESSLAPDWRADAGARVTFKLATASGTPSIQQGRWGVLGLRAAHRALGVGPGGKLGPTPD
jgi:hypothetical protein